MTNLLQTTTDWRYKYVGIHIFKLIINKLDDMVSIYSLFPVIFEHSNYDNEKIRTAALSTVEELEDHFQPYSSEKYASQPFPVILSKINDPVHIVQLEATETLNTLISTTGENVLNGFIESILDTTFNIFLIENIPINLRECLLNIVATLAAEIQERIKPYASKCLSLICNYFNNSYVNQINKPIYGNLIECITILGPFDKDIYYQIIPSLLKAILQIQDSTKLSTDPIRPYIQDSLPRLVYVLKADIS